MSLNSYDNTVLESNRSQKSIPTVSNENGRKDEKKRLRHLVAFFSQVFSPFNIYSHLSLHY